MAASICLIYVELPLTHSCCCSLLFNLINLLGFAGDAGFSTVPFEVMAAELAQGHAVLARRPSDSNSRGQPRQSAGGEREIGQFDGLPNQGSCAQIIHSQTHGAEGDDELALDCADPIFATGVARDFGEEAIIGLRRVRSAIEVGARERLRLDRTMRAPTARFAGAVDEPDRR
jgi:hypothetical protein